MGGPRRHMSWGDSGVATCWGPGVNIFDLREQLVTDYGNFIRGFLKIRDVRLNAFVRRSLDEGVFWPEPYISLNPNFASGGYVDDLVAAGTLHRGCLTAFRRDKENAPGGLPLRLHRHQAEAIDAAASGENYVRVSGTARPAKASQQAVRTHQEPRGVRGAIFGYLSAEARPAPDLGLRLRGLPAAQHQST
jgi:hypothetical protein